MLRSLSPVGLGISATQSELVELVLTHGFKAVELDVVALAADAQEQGLARARRFFESAKLRFSYFRLPIRLEAEAAEWPAELARLGELAQIAAESGCTRCVVAVEPGSDERPYHQNFEFHRQRLSDVARTLEPQGIRLGIGFRAAAEMRAGKAFEFVHDFEALKLLASMVPQANAGFWIDLWELWASGSSIEAVRKLPTGKLVAVELADAPADLAPAEAKQSDRLLPGETGTIDAAAALVALAESGFDGPVTPTAHPSRLQGQRRDAVAKAAGERLEQAWKSAGLSPQGKLTAATSS